MSEAKAIVLFIASLLVLLCAVAVPCIKLGVGGAVLGLMLVVFAAVGGYGSSVIVMHYDKLEERRKREEILLSR